MPQELAGFYYDSEKNRYFPIKGPIPGSSRKPVNPPFQPLSPLPKVRSAAKKDSRLSKLLHYRELYGSTIRFGNQKGNFQEEYRKKLASKPKVWRYEGVEKDADRSVSLANINVETPEGQCRTNVLLTGGVNGSFSLFDIGNVGEHFNHGVRTAADFVWPDNIEEDCSEMLKDIWKFNGATLVMPSAVSCISVPKKEFSHAGDDGSTAQRAVITTLGSELSGGSVYVLNLADPVDLNSSMPAVGRLHELASLNCTVWGADTNCSGNKAVVGSNLGAILVDLETSVSTMICRSMSDVLSVQLIQSDNAALCGLRNGAIVTVDARQHQRQLARHRIPYPSRDSSTTQKMTKPWFVLRGNIQPSCTIYMPSSVSCLESLRTYDQYFLASSMDGSIKLYDHRLTNRGPVQLYEGHVNSHSHIQLKTDESERYIMSGGEDCKVRIWSIKSGEMLFEEKFSDCIPLTVCWQGCREFSNSIGATESLDGCHHKQTHSSDAWIGSAEGLLRLQFS